MDRLKSNVFKAILLLCYGAILIFGISNHELWGDELHSWNIAKGSESLSQLFQNIRYEGHPPFWYLCLFTITRFTHALVWLKVLQGFFAIATAAIILFRSPFSILQKIMLLCGYYFVFEYAVLARNYMPAIFFASWIAVLDRSQTRFRVIFYYLLLFLLSNVHLIGLILAVSIHTSICFEKIKSGNSNAIKLLAGFLIFLPSIYFILPPQDSQLNFQFWIEKWNYSQLYLFITVIVKSLFPFPDFINQHWWNTNLFLDNDTFIFRTVSFLLFAFLLSAIIFSVRNNKTALVLLISNLALTLLLSFVFPLNSARYVGFVFIGFILSAWIALNHGAQVHKLFYLLLFLQIPGAWIAYASDMEQKFSSAENVREVLKSEVIEPGSLIATDYWTLNNLSAYADSSFYTIELHRSVSFLQWNNELKNAINFDYGKGLSDLLTQNNEKSFYFFSMKNPEQAAAWSHWVKFTPVFFSGPVVERSGEVFLYFIEAKG